MKKILVVLLILAVTTGAFAQWTISASGKMATRLNFNVDPITTGLYNVSRGTMGLAYTRNTFKTGLDFKTSGLDDNVAGKDFSGWFSINAANYFFRASSGINALLTADGGTTVAPAIRGWYKLLNGMLKLEVSSNDGWESTAWLADNTVDRNLADKFREEFLLANIELPVGFQFGFYLNNIFQWENRTPSAPAELMAETFGDIVAGAKITVSPFTVGAMFATRDYQTYFGATGVFGPVTAGISFWGAFPGGGADIRAGASVAFNGGFFGAGLKGLLVLKGEDSADYKTSAAWSKGPYDKPGDFSVIEISPNMWINAIPSYLQFKLNATFKFITAAKDDDLYVTWKINPEATWNFLGTGAGTWDTGFYLGYTFETGKSNVANNFMKIGFSWSM